LRYAIGVDLGATKVRVALADIECRFLWKTKEETSKQSEGAIADQIVRMSRSLCQLAGIGMGKVQGLCIASAGPLDLRRGGIAGGANFPFKFIPLEKPVHDVLKVPVRLLNDCTASVLGEHVFGAGKNIENMVYITLSTGIGGGAIVDGHLLIGKDGNAVEIGHLTIDLAGRLKCGCGKRGHWEAYCSGRNIPNYVRLRLSEIGEEKAGGSLIYKLSEPELSKLSSEVIFAAARRGDGLALKLLDELGRLNAIGFASVANAFDPELITVGGTVALKNVRLVMAPIRKYIEDYIVCRPPKIMITPLGEDIGLYGAIAAVKLDRERRR
jgi:glucokinase